MGSCARRSSNSRELTGAKLVLALRSLSDDHEPLPAGSATPATGTPLLSTPDTKRTPPVARAANSFVCDDGKSKNPDESAQTNAPLCLALAWQPAAKLELPAVVQCSPPGIVRSEEHTSELQSLAYLVCR